MHTEAHLFSVPNDCLWYDKLWGPSQRVVTLFSISAFWGRHRQLDDSLVGQLTRDAPLGDCPIIEACNQYPSYANENLDPDLKNFADDSCGCDGSCCKKEVKDPKVDGGNREAIEEDGLPCSTPLTGYNQDDPILVSKTSHNPSKAQPPWSTRSPICPR